MTGYQKMVGKPAPESVGCFRPGRKPSAEPAAYVRRDVALLARIGRRRALQTLNDRRFRGHVSPRPDRCVAASAGA